MRKVAIVFFLLLLLIFLDLSLAYLTTPESIKKDINVMILDHPYYNHGFVSNVSDDLHFGPQKVSYKINSIGLRDAYVRQVHPTSNKRRIAFVGDSFIEGVGCDYKSTLCGLLAARCDTVSLDILNAGVRLYSPKLSYLRIKYLIEYEHLKLDDVYCAIDKPCIPLELVYENYQPVEQPYSPSVLERFIKYYKLHSLLYITYKHKAMDIYLQRNNLDDENSMLYWASTDNKYNEETSFHFLEYRAKWCHQDYIRTAATQKVKLLALNNLKELQQLCAAHHIKFHIVAYPSKYDVFSAEKDPYFKASNDIFLSMLYSFTKENKLDFINLFPLFVTDDLSLNEKNASKYFIPGDVHWNEAGSQLVADSLYHHINL